MKKKKILVLTRYSKLGASSRVRFHQFEPHLNQAGYTLQFEPLFDDQYLQTLYGRRRRNPWQVISCFFRRLLSLRHLFSADIIWLEKEIFPNVPAWFERMFGHKLVVDIDDAVFHNYDLTNNRFKRFLLGQKIDQVFNSSQLVLAGNEYLAERARQASAKRVEIMPTVVDTDVYRPSQSGSSDSCEIKIGWIGSPSTFPYFEDVLPLLRELKKRFAIGLICVGAGKSCSDVEFWPWSEELEAEQVASFDIGIMPLRDGPWERGKCAYKIIQYMSCGVPVVASPIGANLDVLSDGVEGFFASSAEEWSNRLEQLIEDADLRMRMGRAGRAIAINKFSLQQNAKQIENLFGQLN